MASPLVIARELRVPYKGDVFRVELGVPRRPLGTIFLLRDNGNVVHGSAMASALRQSGFGTAICHLLTEAERERAVRHRRVPICTELLARRLLAVVDAVGDDADLGSSAAGIAASGTAAAAALRVATLHPAAFHAIACRHARILSAGSLKEVRAATLFLAVVGDFARIRPMTRAFQELRCAKRFEIVSGGSVAFDDQQSFDQACALTTAWMRRHVAPIATREGPPSSPGASVATAIWSTQTSNA